MEGIGLGLVRVSAQCRGVSHLLTAGKVCNREMRWGDEVILCVYVVSFYIDCMIASS